MFTIFVAVSSWKFKVFQCRPDSPQVNRKLISSITNLEYELPHHLPNNLRHRILGH